MIFERTALSKKPEALIRQELTALHDKGELTKESLRTVLQQYIDAFAAFVDKQNR